MVETHPIQDTTVEDPEARTRALQSLLIEKELISTDAVDEVLRIYEEEIGPLYGAKVVARAWTDPDYRERLLSDPMAVIGEFDLPAGTKPVEVVENTPAVHNVIVCTMCSCYPWALLGLPPTWYKSKPYRARMVREPREVLAEFGLHVDEDREVRVWDQTSELRYMVLPQQPEGTEHLSEEELRGLVTRDAMVGVATVEYDDE